jgi:hypothetical protein
VHSYVLRLFWSPCIGQTLVAEVRWGASGRWEAARCIWTFLSFLDAYDVRCASFYDMQALVACAWCSACVHRMKGGHGKKDERDIKRQSKKIDRVDRVYPQMGLSSGIVQTGETPRTTLLLSVDFRMGFPVLIFLGDFLISLFPCVPDSLAFLLSYSPILLVIVSLNCAEP